MKSIFPHCKLYWWVFLLASALHSSPSFGAEQCEGIPRHSPHPLVAICQDQTHVAFYRGNEWARYSRQELLESLQELIISWLEATSFPMAALCQAQVSLWLSVPEANPLAAQLRLVVDNKHMPFVGYLPWQPAHWQLSNDNTAILPEQSYPQSFGYRMASVLVKKHSAIPPERLRSYLQEFGLHSPMPFATSWFAYSTQPFHEDSSLLELASDGRSALLIETTSLNPVFEWIADRVKGLSFTWPCTTGRGQEPESMQP